MSCFDAGAAGGTLQRCRASARNWVGSTWWSRRPKSTCHASRRRSDLQLMAFLGLRAFEDDSGHYTLVASASVGVVVERFLVA